MPTISDFKKLAFEPNETIFEEDQPADAVFLIVGGQVEIRTGLRDNSPQRLAVCKKGDVIGEMALIEDRPHTASAVALTRTTVLAMPRLEFMRRVKDMDPVMRGIVLTLVGRLRQMDLVVAHLRKMPGALKSPMVEAQWVDWQIK